MCPALRTLASLLRAHTPRSNTIHAPSTRTPSTRVPRVRRTPSLVLSTPRNAGSLDDKIYTMTKYEKVQEWLMDPDLCPTNWDVLHSICAQNPEYHARRTPAGASPTPSQM